MKVRVNLQSDPISLTIMAATGSEHAMLEGIGHDGIADAEITGAQSQPSPGKADETPTAEPKPDTPPATPAP